MTRARGDQDRRAATVDAPGQSSGIPTARPDDDPVDRPTTDAPPPRGGRAGGGLGRRIAARAAARLAATSPTGRYVAVLAFVAAVVALLVKYLLFPHLSINNDEALYRLQAQTLAAGRLFPVAGDPAASYAPWLAVPTDGHYVLKYTPFVPALFALSLLVTGGFGAGLALVAAAAVVTTYRLGLALFADRRVAAVAATLFTTSPLVVLLDGMLLAYLPVLVLAQLAVLGLLRGLAAARGAPSERRGWRDRRGWALAGAGLAAGTAVAVRPFDVLVLLAPLACWAVWTARGGRGWLLGRVGLGLVPPAALLLAFNAAATGSPLRLPFAYLESEDKMGFGVRRLYPTDRAHDFGFLDGLSAVGNHLFLLGGWACGGVVMLGCAVAAVARRRVGAAGTALGVGALLFLAGYVAFWGAWNAAFLWGGIKYIGPFYLLPVLAVLVQLGARGLVDLAAWRPRLAGAAGAVAAGLTCLVLAFAIPANVTLTRHDRDLDTIVDALPGEPLVFLSVDPEYLMHPTSLAANPPELDGRVRWAVTRGGAADLAVVADNPGRPAYLLRIPPAYNRTPDAPAGTRLERLAEHTGDAVTLDVAVDPSPERAISARLVVTGPTGDVSYPIDPDRPVTARLVIDADGVTLGALTRQTGLTGNPKVLRTRTPPARAGNRVVALAVYVTPADTGKEKFVDRQLAPTVVNTDGTVTVLASTGQVAATPGREPPPLHLAAPGSARPASGSPP
ncbi:glycosyl transferase [Frankia nepalensis]|uniref:glycosyl transferase n=1 Tax=Frankia nepalensis TaxID=1836974 RepID=UPI0027DD27C2|nr:glycosyl transferase [Frankia nepalensis]